jgi:hypothetical protein
LGESIGEISKFVIGGHLARFVSISGAVLVVLPKTGMTSRFCLRPETPPAAAASRLAAKKQSPIHQSLNQIH